MHKSLDAAILSQLREEPNSRKYRHHIICYFGRRVKMHNVTRHRIGHYRANRLRNGASPMYINKEVAFLLRVLRASGYCFPVRHLKNTPRPVRRLTPQEWRHLIDTATGNGDWLSALAMAVVAVTLNRHWSDIRKLTWQCQDPFREVMVVDGVEYPWTRDLRNVLIALEQKRLYAPQYCKVTDRILNWRSWQNAWKAMTRAAGFPGLGIRNLIQCAHGQPRSR